jgi:hypothetical protein
VQFLKLLKVMTTSETLILLFNQMAEIGMYLKEASTTILRLLLRTSLPNKDPLVELVSLISTEMVSELTSH